MNDLVEVTDIDKESNRNDSLVLEREPSGRQHAVAKEASIAGSNRSALVSRQPDARRYFFHKSRSLNILFSYS